MRFFKLLLVIFLIISAGIQSFGQGPYEYSIYIKLATRETDSLIKTRKSIYSGNAIQAMRPIIDSMNKAFALPPVPKYYSRQQALGHYLYLRGDKASAAKKDIGDHISFEQFIKKYPTAEIIRNQLIIKDISEGRTKLEAISFDYNDPYGRSLDDYTVSDKWAYKYYDNTEPALFSYYLSVEFSSTELPEKYEKMVGYTDYIADTNILPFYPGAAYAMLYRGIDKSDKVRAFLDYINKETEQPDINSIYKPGTYLDGTFDSCYQWYKRNIESDNAYVTGPSRKATSIGVNEFRKNYVVLQQYKSWFTNRYKIIDSALAKTETFKDLYNAAVDDAMERGYTDDAMEDYVERYSGKDTALHLKRGRFVTSGCGNDDRPYYHIHNIMRLAAETGNSRLFLHCSLIQENIFDGSDGELPHSYIRQLEQLHVNSTDFLMGTLLNTEQPEGKVNFNHRNSYFRLANNLGNTSDTSLLETAISMISDPQLDSYNRILFCKVYCSYVDRLKNGRGYQKHIERLKKAIETLPDYFAKQIILPKAPVYIK